MPTDKKRLNWLTRHEQGIYWTWTQESGKFCHIPAMPGGKIALACERTPRQVIDAAMKAEKRGEEEKNASLAIRTEELKEALRIFRS